MIIFLRLSVTLTDFEGFSSFENYIYQNNESSMTKHVIRVDRYLNFRGVQLRFQIYRNFALISRRRAKGEQIKCDGGKERHRGRKGKLCVGTKFDFRQ